jgi:hypothetical protein
MTKQVHDNDMVAHLWANQSQDSARSNNGNFWFEGAVLYSYRTPIARLVTVPPEFCGAGAGGNRLVALITSEGYSPTTGRHKHDARSAASHLPVFEVPSLGVTGGRHREPGNGREIDHAANVAYLVEGYTSRIDMLKRQTRALGDGWQREHLFALRDDVFCYCDAFEIARPELQPRPRLSRKSWRNTPSARKRTKKARAYLEDWRAGRVAAIAYYHSSVDIALRVKGDTVETSRGAVVPLEDARRLFPIVARQRAKGQDIIFDAPVRVGLFMVSKIDANGDLTAGCHFIKWTEIERLARSQGWVTA